MIAMSNEQKMDKFLDWGFKSAIMAIFFVGWSFLTRLENNLDKGMDEMRRDMKEVVKEIDILKTKVDLYHK